MTRNASDEYDRYYETQLHAALEFQDWVQDRLYDHGVSVGAYSSKKYQRTKGENRAGIEIKFDQKWRTTGNLYIEVAEKAHPSRLTYTASGIYRDDNTWLYVIGDYSKAFVFGKKLLKAMFCAKDKYRRVITPTSKGFLLPLDIAERFAEKIIVPESGDVLKSKAG